MDIHMELEPAVRKILDILHLHGEGYVVGGYVRDKLLGLSPKDCDFVTNLSYERLHEIFKDHSPKELGRQFGIIQINFRGHKYEIARYRVDVGTPQDRRKQKVIFTDSIHEDLKRRDFTVNSIAYDGRKFVALENSFEDLGNKIIRFNGDPLQRITEDPLRILRGIRFAVTKDFILDSQEIYRENMELISMLSKERVQSEFEKILLSEHVERGMRFLMELEGMRYILPEFFSYLSPSSENNFNGKKFCHLLEQLEDSSDDLIVRLSILLKDIGLESEKCREVLKNLKFSTYICEAVPHILANRIRDFSSAEERRCRKILSRAGEKNLNYLLEILRADLRENFPHHWKKIFKDFHACFQRIIFLKQPLTKKDLKIDGTDLQALGYSGKNIGEILDQLLEAVLEDPQLNEYEYLEDIVIHYENS